MDINNLSLEEICGKINIQASLIDLQTSDKETLRTALCTLATVTKLANRKDSLYAIMGYYQSEVKTLDEIEFFFNATENAQSPDLMCLILKDLAQNKEASRRRLFMNHILHCLPVVLRTATCKQAESLIQIVESAVWGDKQKARFLVKMNRNKELR
jgi:hypothetical protein